MKISKKPFSLDPGLATMKDNITNTQRQQNWALVAKELKKFGIRVDGDKRAKILEGRLTLINDILSKLFDFDNNGGAAVVQSNRFQDGNISEINYLNNDNSFNENPQNDSTNISIDGKDSTSILIGAPVQKRQELDPLSARGNGGAGIKNQKANTTMNTSQTSAQIDQSSPPKPSLFKHNALTQSVTSLNDLSEGKELGDAETTLEFILLSLSKNLGIKPKQAAGLLSNNHKYLVHVAVKGMKGGDYSKMQKWYTDIYGHTKTIIQLIDNEKEQNSMKLTLNIMKCGLFSTNPELVINCGRFLSAIGQEINQMGGQLAGLAWDWFTDSSQTIKDMNDISGSEPINKRDGSVTLSGGVVDPQLQTPISESGLASCVYAIKKHNSEVIDHIAPIFVHFGKNNYMETFTHHFKNQFQDKVQYISYSHDLVQIMNGSSLFNEAIYHSGVLDEWVNNAVRIADFDGQNTPQERIAALTFLADVWEIKSEKSENNNELAQAILTVLKRGCRDRFRILRTVCFELMFKLLHQYSVNRNPIAPIIYKSLTFLLIEFHMNTEIREQCMKHFSTLFVQVQTIPVAILCEPLLKQIEISANSSYDFNIFDFEFFSIVIQHKRCSPGIALQLIETMLNQATQNIFYANSSIALIIEAMHKNSKDPSLHSLFSTITKQQFLILEDLESQNQKALKQQKMSKDQRLKELNDSIQKNAKNRIITKQLQQEDKFKHETDQQAFEAAILARKTKERLIVNVFKQIIMFGNDMIKQDIRTQLLKSYTNIERQLKVKSKPIQYLLQLYGEDIPQMLQYFVESQMQSNLTSVPPQDSGDQNTYEDLQSPSQNNYQLVVFESQSSNSPKKKKTKAELHLERVLKDIEKIKSAKMEKTEKKNLEEELKKIKNDQLKLNANKQVEKIKIEHGVVPKQVRNYSLDPKRDQTVSNKDEFQIKIVKPKDQDVSDLSTIAAEDQRQLIPYEKENKKPQAKNPVLKQLKEFQLYDIRLEEQKDQDAVRFLIKKNLKLIRNLFSKYANTTGPMANHNLSFDALKNQNSLITVAEMIKLLKDFEINSLQVGQKEVMQMFRLINKEILKKKDKGINSLTVLDFEGFVEFLLQLAVYIYSYESELLPVEYLQKLLDHFKKVAVQKGSTLAKIFEDQTLSGVVDNNVINELNRRLSNDPSYQLPDGFSKNIEKEIENVYRIPDYFPIAESQRVVIECLDGFLFDLFGFHFIEPMSEIKERARAKPVLKAMVKDKIISELSVQNKNVPINHRRVGRINNRLSTSIDINPIRNQKNIVVDDTKSQKSLLKSPRASQAPIISKPPLGVILKLEVAKSKPQNRSQMLETAYVLEEILYSVENNLSTLPPPNYHLTPQLQKKPIINRVMSEKQKKQEDDEKQKALDKKKLLARKKLLQENLEQLKADKETKAKNDEEKKKLEEAKAQEKKRKLDERLRALDEKNQEEWKKKREDKERLEDEKKRNEKQIELVDVEKKRREVSLQVKQRTQAMIQALQKKQQDKASNHQREEEKKTKKTQDDKAKREQSNKEIAQKKAELNENKEKQRQEFIEFMESQGVQKVFSSYDKPLYQMFDTYSKFDSRDGGTLSYNSYIKMGQKADIQPAIVSSQDYIYIHKTILRNRKNVDQSMISDSTKAPQGTNLSYEDFKEAMVKIAILGAFMLKDLDSLNKIKEDPVKGKVRQSLQGPLSRQRSTSSKKSDSAGEKVQRNSNQSLEKEFDVSNVTPQIIENLFKYLKLKVEKNKKLNNQSKGNGDSSVNQSMIKDDDDQEKNGKNQVLQLN